MEPCKGSDRIFTSRNPWVVAILALAAEIYTADAIKLNLKFDVEMLFRHFSIKVNDIKATDTLKCHTRTATENPDFHADRQAWTPSPPCALLAAPTLLSHWHMTLIKQATPKEISLCSFRPWPHPLHPPLALHTHTRGLVC